MRAAIDDTGSMSSFLDLLAASEVVLCTGPGGVGKTTVSAAIGMLAASVGHKVLVLTIDPARRLADALGVALDNTPRQIDDAVLAATGLQIEGELWALMLDAGDTFDDLIRRLSPQPATADRILHNVVYTHMSRALAGTLEYMAVEKLFDLRQRYQFDLIVVDTPPSKNVLDFIEAPEWLARFLDERVLKWFLLLHPETKGGGFAKAVLQRTGKVVFDVLARVMGKVFLTELVQFMHAIESMTAEFRRRALAMQALLRSPRATFLVVATGDPFVLRDAAHLHREIARRGIPFGGFVVNRMHPASGLNEPEAAAAAIRAAGANDPAVWRLASKLAWACAEIDVQAELDRQAVHELVRTTHWHGYVGLLPLLAETTGELAGLGRLAARLGEGEDLVRSEPKP